MHYLAGLALIVGLVGCTQATPNLAWVVPTEGSTVSGVVNLEVSALQEPYPENVVFYADGETIAKAYPEDGLYRALWDSTLDEKAQVTLSAKAFAGPDVTVDVRLATRLP